MADARLVSVVVRQSGKSKGADFGHRPLALLILGWEWWAAGCGLQSCGGVGGSGPYCVQRRCVSGVGQHAQWIHSAPTLLLFCRMMQI